MNSNTQQSDRTEGAVTGRVIQPEITLLRMHEVLQRVPFSRTTLWRRVRANEYPAPVRLGGPDSRIIAWRLVDIEAWERSLTTGHKENREISLCH